MKKIKLFLFILAMGYTTFSYSQEIPLPVNFKEKVAAEFNSIGKELKTTEFKLSQEQYYEVKKTEYIQSQRVYKILAGQKSVKNLCDNGTFESGLNPADWNFYWAGGNPVSESGTNMVNTGSFNTGGTHTSQVHHQTQTAGPDPYFPALNRVYNFPAGNTTSLRLGNANTGCGTEKVAKVVSISSANAQLNFSYALVMDNPSGHGTAIPFFEVNLIDAANTTINYNNLINLGNSSNRISSDNPLLLPNDPTQPRRWKNWTCVTADLSSIIGKTIIIEFVNRDCWACGHWGYTYLDNLCIGCDNATGAEGSVKLNLGKTDSCGVPGKICLDYTLPTGSSPSIQLKLEIIQNGIVVNTLNSPTLTTGNNFCFSTNTGGLNSSISGFDYKVTGYPKLGSFALTPKIIGSSLAGIKAGQNNDYKTKCIAVTVTPCDCIPPSLYSQSLTGSLFTPQITGGSLPNFTYKLIFSPTAAYAAQNTAWNNWINTQFGLMGNQVVHQFLLYEIPALGSETLIEQFWSSAPYSTLPNFTATLYSNKKYYIKHGVYYGTVSGATSPLAQNCPWKESRVYILTESGSYLRILTNNNGDVLQQIDLRNQTIRQN